jgi:predicted CopG family antitoxin
MKTVPLHLEDDEHEQLLKKKGKMSWHDFIMTLANGKENNK